LALNSSYARFQIAVITV